MVFVILAGAAFVLCQLIGFVFGLAARDLLHGVIIGCLTWGLLMALFGVLWLTGVLVEAVS